MIRRLEAKVTGVVQGVMFRDFVKRKALGLKVTGFVRNESDSSVRVVAEGEEEDLNIFIKKLWKGPIHTFIRRRVDNVEVDFKEPTNEFKDFVIKYE